MSLSSIGRRSTSNYLLCRYIMFKCKCKCININGTDDARDLGVLIPLIWHTVDRTNFNKRGPPSPCQSVIRYLSFSASRRPDPMMSRLPMSVDPTSPFDTALLKLANSRHTIYEHTRMAGENRSPHKMLPLNRYERFSSALDASYACNMATYFGVVSVSPSSRVLQQELLSETLLLVAHSQRSIYDTTRISGENRAAHRMLPTDCYVERVDRCSDATDAFYAIAMANYFVTKNISPL